MRGEMICGTMEGAISGVGLHIGIRCACPVEGNEMFQGGCGEGGCGVYSFHCRFYKVLIGGLFDRRVVRVQMALGWILG